MGRRATALVLGCLLLTLLLMPSFVSSAPDPLPPPRNGPAPPSDAATPTPVPHHGVGSAGVGVPANPVGRGGPPAQGVPAGAPPGRGPAGTGTAQCSNPGDNAVDQNGVSVDVWAAGLRKACGFMGYESGDDPMPAGTPLPPPRPFRFDSIDDPNESVFGFKVFYLQKNANHCGDLRVILHMGGAPSGATTRFHTAQIAYAHCTGGQVKIIDVGGQIDTGVLLLRSAQSGNEQPPQRETADTASCPSPPHPVNLNQNFPCYTTWYAQLYFEIPGSGQGGTLEELPSIIVAFQVDNPIALTDPNNLARLVPTGVDYDGTTRSLGDWFMWNINSGTQTTWSTRFSNGVNRVVAHGTPGAWTNRVDSGIATPGYSGLFASAPGNLTRHRNPVAGIVYPN